MRFKAKMHMFGEHTGGGENGSGEAAFVNMAQTGARLPETGILTPKTISPEQERGKVLAQARETVDRALEQGRDREEYTEALQGELASTQEALEDVKDQPAVAREHEIRIQVTQACLDYLESLDK